MATLCAPCSAQQISPQGEFAEIRVSEQNQVLEKLLEGDESTIDKVLSSSEKYSPPVLYVLSNALFNKNRKDEAMFWFYTGQLRARSDANKSLDISARQAVAALNDKFGPPINLYAFTDIPKLKNVVADVVKQDAGVVRGYDPRWISLHGMDAFLKTKIAFEPEEKWAKINDNTRNEYLDGFRKAMSGM